MKVKGFELKPRMAYDSLIVSSYEGGNILLTCSKMLYDSIKLNWNWISKMFWYRWKLKPSKLLKSLTDKQLLEAAKQIRILEGAKEEDLIFFDFHLGNKTIEEFTEYLKENKKKVELIQSITNQ